jgi:hypothetical protein
VVGTGAGGAVLFAGGLLALSGLNLRGCTIWSCEDPCVDDPTKLTEAATKGDLARVRELGGRTFDERTTAAECALRFGHVDATVALMAEGTDDLRLVRVAADRGAVTVVETALVDGADPQAVLDEVVGSVIPAIDLSGCGTRSGVERTASPEEHRRMVAAAVAAGADPNGAPGSADDTVDRALAPLLRAAHNGRVGAVRGLLDAGAEPDGGGAVSGGLVSMARSQLLGYSRSDDALPVAPDHEATLDDVTPLMAAATAGHAEVVDVLLQAGADPDRASQDSFVALHAAAARDDRAMADALLDAGASPAPVLEGGAPMPAETARRLGHTDLADHLDLVALAAALEPVPG